MWTHEKVRRTATRRDRCAIWRRSGAATVGGSCEPERVIERPINFERPRWMRCGSCRYEWLVTAEWLDRFNQALVACTVCNTDCRGEDRPDFCADPEDPVHNDSAVRSFYWYHSSTHENWPDSNFDPAARLTEDAKRRMEATGSGVGAVQRWAERQKAKALHVGTYEAAIESMFRRMSDQGGSSDEFYLFRVVLDTNCVIEPGVHREPTDWVGDAYLTEVCAPGTNVLRYVNVHEDQSSVSLAIEPSAVRAVQRTPLPLAANASDAWILSATQRLVAAASKPSPESNPEHRLWMRRENSALSSEARKLESEIAARLPSMLRERFNVAFNEEAFEAAPDAFPVKLVGIAHLVTSVQATLDALDTQPWNRVHPGGRDAERPVGPM